MRAREQTISWVFPTFEVASIPTRRTIALLLERKAPVDFGGKIECVMTYESRPAEYPVPAEWRKKILHASLMVGDQVLMGADAPPDRYQKPQGFSVTLGLRDQAEAERIFTALAEKGTVEMALQETFWAIRFGVLVDRFGIPWTINCERPA